MGKTLKCKEDYLNEMTQMHFEMNKEMYPKPGIPEHALYKTGAACNFATGSRVTYVYLILIAL